MNSPFTVQGFEDYAYDNLPKNALNYYRSGAREELTLEANKSAFKQLRVKPHFLYKHENAPRKSCELLQGANPIGVAPTAMHKLAHPDGELATVKACEQTNSVYILSTLATSSIEQVAQKAPNAHKWFQLYVYRDRALTLSLVQRAKAAGFKALVITIDTPIIGTRFATIKNHFQLPPHLHLANFEESSVQSMKHDDQNLSDDFDALAYYSQNLFDQDVDWIETVKWLRTKTDLPILLKGILTHEDAAISSKIADGIIVSNHGARQLDQVSSSIEALPEVLKGAQGKVPVFLDGGVRTGLDVFKALALGAQAVFVGRPILWGLTHSGQEGVKKVLQLLNDELHETLLLSGCKTLSNISPHFLSTEKSFKKVMKNYIKSEKLKCCKN